MNEFKEEHYYYSDRNDERFLERSGGCQIDREIDFKLMVQCKYFGFRRHDNISETLNLEKNIFEQFQELGYDYIKILELCSEISIYSIFTYGEVLSIMMIILDRKVPEIEIFRWLQKFVGQQRN